jgi:multidrug efflux pump
MLKVKKSTSEMNWVSRFFEWCLGLLASGYERTLTPVLRHPWLTMLALAGTIGLNVFLFVVISKGFFPEQDTGRIMGSVVGDQAISFDAMKNRLKTMMDIVGRDPAVTSVLGFVGGSGPGGGAVNSARVFISLKDVGQRPSLIQCPIPVYPTGR